LSKKLTPPSYAVFNKSTAKSTSTCFLNVTQEPKESADTFNPEFPKRRYSMFLSLDECLLLFEFRPFLRWCNIPVHRNARSKVFTNGFSLGRVQNLSSGDAAYPEPTMRLAISLAAQEQALIATTKKTGVPVVFAAD
jgi:hypothetical protein